MPCNTKPPTGEKQPPKYVAPAFVPTASALTQRFLQSQLGAIQANLQALNSSVAPSPQTQALKATSGTVQAREGDTIRVAPGPGGVTILLPASRAANRGKDISVLVETAGTVTVSAVDSMVQGVATITLSGIGLRVFRSDGGDGNDLGGWWIVGQNSANSGNQLMAVSAGTTLASSGTVAFADSNGVTFGMNTSGVVTASVSRGIGLTVPGSTTTVTGLAFSNNNNMSWTIGGGTQIVGRPHVIASVIGQTLNAVSRLVFNSANGVTFGISTAGVEATITASIASSLTAIRVSAGTTSNLLSAVTFSNANGVSFGLNASTITASIATSLTAINLSAGTTSANLSAFTLSNSNNVSFGLNGSVVTASATVASTQASINLSAGTTSNLASAFTFANANGLSFGLNAGTITGSYTVPVVPAQTSLVFSNSNNVTFGVAGSTLTASASFPAQTAFVLSSSNGISFGTAGSTVTASYTVPAVINSGLLNITGAASSVNASRLVLSNANGFSWLLSTAGSIATLSASYTVPTATSLSFANSNGVTFGIAGSTLTASVPELLGLVSHVGGNSVGDVSRLAMSNANNITFSLSTAAGAATMQGALSTAGTYSWGGPQQWQHVLQLFTGNQVEGGALPLAITLAASTTHLVITTAGDGLISSISGASTFGRVVYVLIFGSGRKTIVNSVGTDSAIQCPGLVDFVCEQKDTFMLIGRGAGEGWIVYGGARTPTLVSHVGGNSMSQLSRLAFANSNGVTFGLSTAAGAGTVTASVNAGVGGGIAAADELGSTLSTGTLVFNSGDIPSPGTRAQSDNVAFEITNNTVRASAFVAVGLGTTGAGNVATRIDFMNTNGVSWVKNTTNMAGSGHIVMVEASVNTRGPALHWYRNWPAANSGSNLIQVNAQTASMQLSPMGAGDPFPGPMTIDSLDLMVRADPSISSSYSAIFRIGIYTLQNSTRLSLLNSVAHTQGAAAQNTTLRSASINGNRYMGIVSSQWSAQPVLEPGEQYWIGIHVSSVNANVLSAYLGKICYDINSGVIWAGTYNAASVNSNSRYAPFWGGVATAGIPATIGTANVVQGAVTAFVPWMQFRHDVAQ